MSRLTAPDNKKACTELALRKTCLLHHDKMKTIVSILKNPSSFTWLVERGTVDRRVV